MKFADDEGQGKDIELAEGKGKRWKEPLKGPGHRKSPTATREDVGTEKGRRTCRRRRWPLGIVYRWPRLNGQKHEG